MTPDSDGNTNSAAYSESYHLAGSWEIVTRHAGTSSRRLYTDLGSEVMGAGDANADASGDEVRDALPIAGGEPASVRKRSAGVDVFTGD